MILEIYRKSENRMFEVLIDSEDYDLVKGYKWNIVKHKTNKTYYVQAYIKGSKNGRKQKYILMHRLVMSAPEGIEVDHINHNGLDNRKSKLRFITHGGNQRNKKTWNNLGFKGVDERPSGRFRASIRINKKLNHIGTFDTVELAHEAYMKEYHIQIEKETIECPQKSNPMG